MKAVGLYRYLPIDDPESLIDLELPTPSPQGRELLVKVHAVSVNPVDCKVRAPKDKVEPAPRVLGWDAAGEVAAVGPDATLFRPGDRVWYAGDITRAGSNAEFQLVDERIVGPMPASLSFEQAAALPLTAITAWEALFDRLQVPTPPHALPRRTILIVGGAGGVASIAIQLAAKVAGLTVIATASRPESRAWVQAQGAHHVVDHAGDLAAQLRAIGHETVDYVFVTSHSAQHFAAAAAVVAPQGRVCLIEGENAAHDVSLLKAKSAALLWEFMFTRSMFGTADMIAQHRLLVEIARLIDAGVLTTTLGKVLGPIDAATLRQAHAALEADRAIGKLVLSGF